MVGNIQKHPHARLKSHYNIVRLVLRRSWLGLGQPLGSPMYSSDEFSSLEIMCRQRATLAKRKMELWFAEAEYWLLEAEEWKQLRRSADPTQRKNSVIQWED
jgi:hypothetical protein